MFRTRRSAFALATTMALVMGSLPVLAADDALDIEQELASVQAQLAEMTVERDALLAEQAMATARYEKSRATQQVIFDIIADPPAFGTQEEVLDLLDTLAVPGMVYGDDAFGSVSWRSGWRNTLFSGVDATIHTWKSWLSDDGSVGGSMWTWSGATQNGEHFDLEGINLDTYDENGLSASVTVYYPYEDAEVKRRFREGNVVLQ